MDNNLVILVDENDHETGSMQKLEAHQKGLLHRAFSILVKNSENKFLIHKRAEGKYHSEGLWTNTCCSHPAPGETISDAAHRRLMEEMGFDCELEKRFHFIYRTTLENHLVEHELDHVFTGISDQIPVPNPEEVSEYKWITPEELAIEMQQHPENFTYWFRLIMQEYSNQL